MPIQYTQVKAVSDTELARANSLETQVASLSATVDAQATEIARLKALVAPPPPVVVPPPPTPARAGLYVDGGKLRTRFGAELRLRVIEVMLNGNLAGYGYTRFLTDMRAVGFNAVSPLFQGSYGAVAEVREFLDAALALNMVVGVNADHQGDTQGWATSPALVALLNGYPNVYLVCDVETYTGAAGDSVEAWSTAERAKVKKFRDAGHTCPIKAGAHGGGRDVRYPLAKGAEVLASDPLKNVLFTWQAYWKAATGGWQYSEANGFTGGIAGTKAALAACAASGLCFVPGFDVTDDVGATGEAELITAATGLGMSWAHWAATGDARQDNNLRDWDFRPLTPPKATEVMLAGKCVAARGVFLDVTAL